MKIKKFLFVIFVFFLVISTFFTRIVMAATTGTVTATVTAQSISLTVTDGTVTYGTLALNASKSTIPADLNDMQTATNNGNITENFNIKGSNSASWTLDSANTTQDHYIHQFCTASCTTPPTNFTALTTNDQTLATGVATSGTQTFYLRITTPQSSSVYTEQSVNVTITAVSPS